MRLRLAHPDDLPALRAVMDRAIGQLQSEYLSAEQVESSRAIMGLDTQLVEDGTYFVVEVDDRIAGCGGWSRRATTYGSDSTPGRDAHLLDPAVDAARVRAMYTDPEFVRRGVGRLILRACEDAARVEGFSRLMLVGTMAGQPLYERYGFTVTERRTDDRGGAPVPLVVMEKSISRL